MFKITRVKSDNNDFRELVKLLDEELSIRYGPSRMKYDKFNKIESIDTVVIGYLNDKPAGCGCFRMFDSQTAEIKRMFVKSGYRGSGIAAMILNELEKWAAEQGFLKSVLETAIKQPEAIKFYTKLGYYKIENYNQYSGDPTRYCMMKNFKVNSAISTFKSGLNCAQAVLTAYSDDFGLDNNLALSISCGFGGGMGRLQETCGAVTGAYMVLGIYSSGKYSSNNERKEQSYALIQKFSEKFKSIRGTTNCKSLLNCDIMTAEGRQFATEHRIFDNVCEKCISDSINIIEELIAK